MQQELAYLLLLHIFKLFIFNLVAHGLFLDYFLKFGFYFFSRLLSISTYFLWYLFYSQNHGFPTTSCILQY